MSRYEFGRIISSGMIGIVYLVRDRSDKYGAMRCIKMMPIQKMFEKRLLPSIKNEIEILYEIRNIKGCIRLLDAFNDDKDISLVFPYYFKRDLYHYCKISPRHSLKEWAAQKIFKQLINILIKLHAKNIIHRDIKPENILIDDDAEIVLTDFGFAIKKEDLEKQNYTRVGTLEFYPIEMVLPVVLSDGREAIRYDERIDIWSTGVVLFELLYGVTPFFAHNNDEETKARIRKLQYQFPSDKFHEA